MKQRALHVVLILVLSLSTNTLAQTYDWVDWSAHMPEQVGFSDVHFIGNEGWVAGGNSKLYHSTDGGQTFTTQNLLANSGITNSIFMKSTTEGYLVTSTGKIFRSTDAGNGDWTAIAPGASVAFYSISFPPTDTIGYASGNSGRIYRITPSRVMLDTAYAGATLTSIVFPASSNQGWVCGGSFIRHKNVYWLDDQFYYAGNSYNAIHFVDNSNGWVVGSGGGPPDRGIITHTSDGINWNGQINPDTLPSRILNDVYFLNSQEGWTVGAFGIILHTTDGGGTPDGHWQIEGQSVASGKLLRAVFAVDNQAVYVVGNNTFLKYTQVTDVGEKEELPTAFALHQNYPNPFNPKTEIGFRISDFGLVTLKVYDVLGREMLTLVNEVKQPGVYTVQWDATGVASGVYFCRMTAGLYSETKKLMVLQ